MMMTLQLLEELLKKSDGEVNMAMFELLKNHKLDFVKLSTIYTVYLESKKEDQLNKLVEAEACILQSFTCNKSNKTKTSKMHIQRCLYLLNRSKRFNMDSLNKKYGYDEELAKTYSMYPND